MENETSFEVDVARACLPEILRVEDVARVLGVGVDAAWKAIRKGLCGPFTRCGRRLLLRRVSFLDALRRREITVRAPARARVGNPAILDALRKAYPLPHERSGDGKES
ncbi:MAG: hypothetical protein AAB074_12995 [Planctomycetota bacterium]